MHEAIAAGYNAVAHEYAARLTRELDGKPFDRDFLVSFEQSTPRGSILDLGCGPGHVARFIADRGRTVVGVDLSPEMVAIARDLNPAIRFEPGDLCALDHPASSFAGVVAFYSIIHLAPTELAAAAQEFRRVLQPGGTLAVAFHAGDEVRHVESLWGIKTDLDFHFLQPSFVEETLQSTGFRILQARSRPPYAPEVESQTTRHYILALRPPDDAQHLAQAEQPVISGVEP